MESKQYDIEVIHGLYFTKTAPAFLFFNKHTVACLPTDEDVSKYNTVADLGEKFDVIEADNYYTFDRELYPVWDEFSFGNRDPELTVDQINALLSSKGIHKNPAKEAEHTKEA